MDSGSDWSNLYTSDKLDQVTLYADFRMDIREDQPEPESRPTYIQDIVSGKRRLISMGRLRSLFPAETPLSPVQRLSARRKSSSAHRMVAHRQRTRERLAVINQQLELEMIAAIPSRYEVFKVVYSMLKSFRLQTLQEDF
jgi:hypothetical protein